MVLVAQRRQGRVVGDLIGWRQLIRAQFSSRCLEECRTLRHSYLEASFQPLSQLPRRSALIGLDFANRLD
jgi:hypothetical protein